MLTDGEASGYDLKKHFESSFGHFFAAGYGSIYPALASLAAAGFVSCEEIPQQGKPDRKVYSITEEGRQRLLRELDQPNPSHKVRSEFLATVCFAHLMTPDQIQTVLNNRIAEINRYLKMFDEFECTCMEQTPTGMHFTVGLGRAVMGAMKKYVEEHGHVLLNDPQTTNQTASG